MMYDNLIGDPLKKDNLGPPRGFGKRGKIFLQGGTPEQKHVDFDGV